MPEENKKGKTNNSGFADKGEVKKVLTKLQHESEEEEAAEYARTLSMPYLDLNIFPIDQENVTFLPEEDAKKFNVGVIHKIEREIKLATTTPENEETKKFVDRLKKREGFKVELFLVSKSSLERVFDEYKKVKLVDVFDYLRMGLSGDDLENFEKDLQGLIDLEKRIKEIPVTQVLNMIIAGSIKLSSSDIHFEPQKNGKVRLRYRIDGVLQTVAEFPINIYPTIVSRIKVLGKMMINVRDAAQDGRFSIKKGDGTETDVRVSVLPGNFGENIVIRLLMSGLSELSLDSIGLTGLSHEWLINESEKKQGIIITSGPTGSGKSTTLYAIINRINSPDRKIISIEDPVEYQVPGVSQTQVEEDKGYTFASGLRAIVRQDPDVVLVGEIRDESTAEIAVQAALTGHLVLTTVHANSSAGVIGRLIDLGVKPTLISPAVNAFIAQRLLRRLCPHCKEEYAPAQETIDTLKKILSLISPKAKVQIPKNIKTLWRPKGCAKCNGLGYKGRIGIYEIMVINSEIQQLIERMATEDELRNVSLENGMITLEQDGILKSVNGTTSLEELQRVVGKGEYLLDLYEKIVIQSLSRGFLIKDKYFQEVKEVESDYEVMQKKIEKSSPNDMVSYILAAGILTKTGDVHIEPGEKTFKVRYRIDGVLHDVMELPMPDFLNILNEIKNLTGAKTESREGVIDGRFRVVVEEATTDVADKNIDVRVSVILGGFGDVIVMRLLNQTAESVNLDKLEINPYNLKLIKNNVAKPNGIILNTGPTGSGKTTTLYSILSYINSPEMKIITVEDPIEYQMDGIIQTQVKEEENYTFATAMRVLLRQNPDVMMIGEIRDQDTASAAYQAALTGHLVLSTLHTNSAASSLQRLMNMGINPSDLGAGTNCFMAQRLIRVLCPDCKKKAVPTAGEKAKIEDIFSKISPKTEIKVPEIKHIYKPGGCKKCHNLGYSGRLPITEVLEVDKEMQKFITTMPTIGELREKGIAEGMLTMAQDGMLKVLEGITALEEIARVTREVEREGTEQATEEEKSADGDEGFVEDIPAEENVDKEIPGKEIPSVKNQTEETQPDKKIETDENKGSTQ